MPPGSPSLQARCVLRGGFQDPRPLPSRQAQPHPPAQELAVCSSREEQRFQGPFPFLRRSQVEAGGRADQDNDCILCTRVGVSVPKQLAPHEAQERHELRACLRWHRLWDELRNSPEEMQVLSGLVLEEHLLLLLGASEHQKADRKLGPREQAAWCFCAVLCPAHGEVPVLAHKCASHADSSIVQERQLEQRPSKEKTGHVSDSGASVVKHGLNPEKTFMQVHYLKGYFLLRFLTRRLGDETYFSFLRKFVHKFHGQLILSQDFLQMLLENIPEEKRLALPITGSFQSTKNTCFSAPGILRSQCADPAVDEEALPELSVENIIQDWLESSGIPKVTKWLRLNRRPRKRRRREEEEVFEKLLPDQLVLLLEHLLKEKTLSHPTLQTLQRTYCLHEQDAEAMGVYLYGELMVREDARQQQLAIRCFELVKEQMDKSSVEVVAEMLF
ncbi:Aminopeptidase O [Fukomys damarensis]|uniref:Aminopeptidase O n=1 Tax=Fukomys damarensis TaxID=885580 RepID=A0A091DBL2_FUKDA|nr:Aminopeptidase O [Fukomys damarensis]